MGLLHTDAFEQLAELYKDKKPDTKLDLMMDLSGIMAGYCEEDDEACKSLAYEATLTKFHSKRIAPEEVKYPEMFDTRLKKSIDTMFEVIKEIDEGNVDDVVDSLIDITNEMRDMEDVDSFQRELTLSAISIAVESTKLWHSVHITDKDHPLRRLQEAPIMPISDFINQTNSEIMGDTLTSLYETISTDITAALDKGTAMVAVFGTTSLDILARLIPIAVISIAYFAIPASAEEASRYF